MWQLASGGVWLEGKEPSWASGISEVLLGNQRRLHLDVAKPHRAMIALKHQRPLRLLRAAQRGGGRFLDLDVFMDDDAIVDHFNELGLGRLLAIFAKSRGQENHVISLPLAGCLADVLAGC